MVVAVDVVALNAPILAVEFAKAAVEVSDFHVPLSRAITTVVAPSIAENFAVGGRPGWTPLADGTLRQKTNPRILIESGTLAAEASNPDNWGIDREEAQMYLPEDAYYGEFHMSGTAFMPARDFATLQDTDEDAIAVVFNEWLGEVIR